MINKRFLVLTFIFLLIGVIAAGEIYFSDPTANNNIRINTNWTVVNLTANTTGDSYSFVDFDNSVLGWWRFENSTNATDETGRSNGTLTGTISTVSGRFGEGYNVSGTDSNIDFGRLADIEGTNKNYSISFWIKMDNPLDVQEIYSYDRDDVSGNDNSNYDSFFIYRATGIQFGALTGCEMSDVQTNIEDGNWHHVVTEVQMESSSTTSQLYVDGLLNSSMSSCGRTWNSAQTDYKLRFAAKENIGQFDGTLDDILVFNRTLSASEVASLYNATANQYYNNFTSLMSGNHTFTGYFVNSSGFKNQTATRNIIVDFETPTISNAFFYPNDTDTLDPGINVTFNATIVDNGLIDSARLSIYNGTGWRNYSMTNKSNVYSANLTLATVEANYTYQIWANDSVGNPAITSNATFSALWDCTWDATSDLGAIAGWNQNKFIGNITINNTGDAAYANSNCSLDFRLTHNRQSEKIYFNGSKLSLSDSYTLNAKTNITLSLNATFLSAISQESVIIMINEITNIDGISSTKERNTTAVIVSNQIGPYLYNSITSNPIIVFLTPNNFSLNGYLRNLMGSAIPNETNTAFNVSFNWVLPTGLINSSGNLSNFYANISDNGLKQMNNYITFSDNTALGLMTPGTKSISLTSSGYNFTGSLIKDANGNTLINTSVNISFQCYSIKDDIIIPACSNSDGDYVAPQTSSSSGGGGGGGGGAAGEQAEPFSKFIKQETNFESVRGEKSEFTLEFTNPYAYGELNNLVLSLSGIDSQYLEITPKTISFLNKSETIKIKVNINAPKYLEDGIYELTFEIKGDLLANGNKQSFLAKKKIKLMISEFSRKDILIELENAKLLIKEMKSSNLSYLPMESLLNEAEILFNESAMGKANSKYLELKKIHDDAFSSKEILSQLNAKILEATANGISTPESSKLVSLAEAAFARGDYSLALARLKEAQLSYALEVKGEFNTAYYVKNHPLQSLGFLIAISFIALASTLTTRRILLNSKLKLLAEEEKLLVGLMKVVQRECFEEKRMSMEEYENTMSQYENRLNVVIQDKIEAETKIANLMKIRGGKRKVLREESIRLKELIKETQRQYFDKSLMETRVYQNMIKSYAARLSEIEENLATIEAQDELRKKGLKL